MTLRCECGGPVRVQNGTEPDPDSRGFFEVYECQTCGRTGGLDADHVTGTTTLTGCLTRTNRGVGL